MKKLVIDLDDTISKTTEQDYANSLPNIAVIEKIKQYKEQGFDIVIYSARKMRTHKGNIGLINVHTLPLITSWLIKHKVPFTEIIIGKPWCGFEGFYVDDKAIRPSEFVNLSYDQIQDMLQEEKEMMVPSFKID